MIFSRKRLRQFLNNTEGGRLLPEPTSAVLRNLVATLRVRSLYDVSGVSCWLQMSALSIVNASNHIWWESDHVVSKRDWDARTCRRADDDGGRRPRARRGEISQLERRM